MNFHSSFRWRSLRGISILTLVFGGLVLLLLASTLIVIGSPNVLELAATATPPATPTGRPYPGP